MKRNNNMLLLISAILLCLLSACGSHSNASNVAGSSASLLGQESEPDYAAYF